MSTRHKRAARLYQDLSYSQKAALTLHYACEQDEAELALIGATVPHATYRMPDTGFRNWQSGFFRLAMAWGLLWWQAQTRLAIALGLLLALDEKPTDERAAATAVVHDAETELASLHGALQEICKRTGLGMQTVLCLTGANVDAVTGKPDPAVQKDLMDRLNECLMAD